MEGVVCINQKNMNTMAELKQEAKQIYTRIQASSQNKHILDKCIDTDLGIHANHVITWLHISITPREI